MLILGIKKKHLVQISAVLRNKHYSTFFGLLLQKPIRLRILRKISQRKISQYAEPI